ncbi:Phosphonoacetate hydrolase [Corynebacterium pseudotuberculosis]|uniref:zinc ribbon domain-containing protein YjdM n=1 Tax=Corynebacterium pseudotuberculosis TaxID=1719 RepID=UPI00065E196E|nr:zinc ribbon domain-containing protein YjdM [Corynebacterium pseudotuberculosis]AKP08409.2 Phosphonoacetate hydrolase [Corynebacterium pseudotuberculosis]
MSCNLNLMFDQLPPCPECSESYTYEQGALLVCPICAYEWTLASDNDDKSLSAESEGIRDAVGNLLVDGDAVTVVKGLKISGGGGGAIKVGTKAKNIRLLDPPVNGHDIDASVPSLGRIYLKSSVVKKA